MIVGIKDSAKLFGIIVLVLCAVLVCSMFVNYYMDLTLIKDDITDVSELALYDALVSTTTVVCLTAGGCLTLTSVVMLIFYIKHYVDAHKKQLGILKALGYSDWKIAGSFWAFGGSIFLGAVCGLAGAYIIMPLFYATQNKDHLIPDVTMHFHPTIFVWFLILPSMVFSLLSILFARFELKRPALSLLREETIVKTKIKKERKNSQKNQGKCSEMSSSFLSDLRKSILSSGKMLVFFMIFSSFCFSAMTQMSFRMKDLSSELMGAIMLIIGLTLAFVTFFLSVSAVLRRNTKSIAIMQAFGYYEKECRRAVLDCYRPLSYIGFLLGTLYQHFLLKLMVNIVFADYPDMPAYSFDHKLMLVSFVSFVVVYELMMVLYSKKIKKMSLREIMSEL